MELRLFSGQVFDDDFPEPAPPGTSRTDGLFQDRLRALEEPIRLLVPALQGVQAREAAPAERRDGVLRTECFHDDCQGALVERFRLRVPAPGNVLQCAFVQDRGRIRSIRPADFPGGLFNFFMPIPFYRTI